MAFKKSPHHSTKLFEDLTDDEDQDPIICLMAKNVKVNSPNSSDDELDEEDEVASLISQYGKKGATKIMKLMMKVDELEETLESQEELLRLERETSKTQDKDLAIERKENKRIKDSLKTNDNILLEVRELLTSKKEKVNDLTKKYSLVEDTNANLRSENAKFQESFTSLQSIHKALEVEHNTTLESNSKASEKSSSSIPSTSNSCACCYNIDIQTCATNHVEMNAMRKEISRFTQLLQDPNEQSSKANPDSRVGEFEKYTKGFGSKYMS